MLHTMLAIFCVVLIDYQNVKSQMAPQYHGFIKRLTSDDFGNINTHQAKYRPGEQNTTARLVEFNLGPKPYLFDIDAGGASAKPGAVSRREMFAAAGATAESVLQTPPPHTEEETIYNFLSDDLLTPEYETASFASVAYVLNESTPKLRPETSIKRIGTSRDKTIYEDESTFRPEKRDKDYKTGSVVLALTVCASRLTEALNSIKSVLMFSKSAIHFVIFTEDGVKSKIEETLGRWLALTTQRFYYELHRLLYPAAEAEYWRQAYTNCTGLKLFFSELLTHIDALIYLDTDTLLLGPVDELWRAFSWLGTRHVAALAAEHNEGSRAWAWYSRHAKHPFYGDFGLNSGVMLMNLTRMRDFGWSNHVQSALRKWKHQIIYNDQDVINIIFDYNPGRVLELPCRFNYRSDVTCAGAVQAGVLVVHGNRGVFHSAKNHVFKAVYRAVEGYEIGTEPLKTFLPNLKSFVTSAWQSSHKCKHLKSSFLKLPIKTLYKI